MRRLNENTVHRLILIRRLEDISCDRWSLNTETHIQRENETQRVKGGHKIERKRESKQNTERERDTTIYRERDYKHTERDTMQRCIYTQRTTILQKEGLQTCRKRKTTHTHISQIYEKRENTGTQKEISQHTDRDKHTEADHSIQRLQHRETNNTIQRKKPPHTD